MFGTSGGFGASKPVLTNQNSYSQQGERVSNPKQIIAIALSQAAKDSPPSPLASMINKKRKKKGA